MCELNNHQLLAKPRRDCFTRQLVKSIQVQGNMVLSERWFGNWGICCRYLSKSLAEAVRNCTIEGYSRNIHGIFPKDFKGICPECNKKVTYRSKGMDCVCCLSLYHVKCLAISDDEYRDIIKAVCYCRKWIAMREKIRQRIRLNFFSVTLMI